MEKEVKEVVVEGNDVPKSDVSFKAFNLAPDVFKAIEKVGYEQPTPIQKQIIPYVLEGRDVIGQAQTGTGKTAAFALPILSNIDPKKRGVQALILAPTRELAIQVAESFQTYAHYMDGCNVLPIYGGQDVGIQLKKLRRGPQIIVGTPGRVMDHIRRKTLVLNGLKHFVLDEADEMLRMGFLDDVEWILEQLPLEHQTALFSATMPSAIRKIALNYLENPKEISIKMKTNTADTINQRYWLVSRLHKLDALSRILEGEDVDGMLIFVRTRVASTNLYDKLKARGYACAVLNGDISQAHRERTVEQFKRGESNILIATDVAARGLDVKRISHVVNYDIPYDTETYIHRIGRTGRAGRKGEAILFVGSREQRLLRAIERATKQKIERMKLPSKELINTKRISDFKNRILQTIETENLDFYTKLLQDFQLENDIPEIKIAAALAQLLQGKRALLLDENSKDDKFFESKEERNRDRNKRREKNDRRRERGERDSGRPERNSSRNEHDDDDVEKETYKVLVGRDQRVKPGDLVGAIANEAGLDSQYIGRIDIHDNHTFIDLPVGMPLEILMGLKDVKVLGHQLKISKVTSPRRQERSSRQGEYSPRRDKKRRDTKKGDRRSNKGNRRDVKSRGDKKRKSKSQRQH